MSTTVRVPEPAPAPAPGQRDRARQPAATRSGFFQSIRDRLIYGGAFLVLLILAGARGRVLTGKRLTDRMDERLGSLRRTTEIGSSLESLILNQIAAGERYLVTPAPDIAAQFADLGRRAHEQRRQYKDLQDLSPAEQQEIVKVEGLHSRIEVEYALAHAQRDIGDTEGALRRVAAVRPQTQELQQEIRKISQAQAEKVATASTQLKENARRTELLLLLIGLVAAAIA